MGLSLKSPKIRSYGQPLVLNVSYHSMTSSVMLTGVQCERRRSFPVSRLLKSSLPGGYIEVLGQLRQQSVQYKSCCRVRTLDAPGLILLTVGRNLFCSQS